MQSIAAACGSSPAPVCLYMPSSWSWKASSKILCRFRRRNPNSGRTRFRRFMMNSSCFVSSTGGFQRSMVAPRGDKRSYHVTLVDTHVRSDRNHCRINLIGALGDRGWGSFLADCTYCEGVCNAAATPAQGLVLAGASGFHIVEVGGI